MTVAWANPGIVELSRSYLEVRQVIEWDRA